VQPVDERVRERCADRVCAGEAAVLADEREEIETSRSHSYGQNEISMLMPSLLV